jgi:hypothetical protein
MCITSAIAITSCGRARMIAGAFELVCRIAGPTIELPPRSKPNAMGNARSTASKVDVGALQKDMVIVREGVATLLKRG